MNENYVIVMVHGTFQIERPIKDIITYFNMLPANHFFDFSYALLNK